MTYPLAYVSLFRLAISWQIVNGKVRLESRSQCSFHLSYPSSYVRKFTQNKNRKLNPQKWRQPSHPNSCFTTGWDLFWYRAPWLEPALLEPLQCCTFARKKLLKPWVAPTKKFWPIARAAYLEKLAKMDMEHNLDSDLTMDQVTIKSIIPERSEFFSMTKDMAGKKLGEKCAFLWIKIWYLSTRLVLYGIKIGHQCDF